MNTLNNQQINPGNRVDFSRIRRFAKGGIPKFATAGKISNTYNILDDFWSGMNNDVIANWSNIAANQDITMDEMNLFISTNRNLYKGSGYDGSKAVKHDGVQLYQLDFHNKYGFGNTDSFWGGMRHVDHTLGLGDVRPGEGEEFKGDGYFGTLTDYRRANYFAADELVRANDAVKARGWEFVLDDALNEGHTVGADGRQFYKLQEIQKPEPEPTPEPTPTPTPTPEPTPTTPTPTTDFKSPQYLPKRKWGVPDTGYLYNIYRNNVDSIDRQLKSTLLMKATKELPVWQNATTTSNYLLRQREKQNLAESRNQFLNQLNSLGGDTAKAMNAAQNFEATVAQPAMSRMEQISQLAIDSSTAHVNSVMNNNNINSINTANRNAAAQTALWNAKNNAVASADARRSAEYADYVNKRKLTMREYMKNEKLNEQMYNQKVNAIMGASAQQLALDEYKNASKNAMAAAEANSGGVTLQAMRDLMMTDNSGTFDLSDEELNLLNDPSADPADVIELVKTHRQALMESNPNAGTWFLMYDQAIKDADDKLVQAKRDIATKQAILNLGYDPYLSGSTDLAGIGTNWQKLYGSTLIAKKGAKLKDTRWEKYLQYRAKIQLADLLATVAESKISAAKLEQQLDSLDRQTLLLLRSIFS